MTIYTRGFSFDLVTRVWDIFLSEGKFKLIYRVALAILKFFEDELIVSSFENIMALIREIPKRLDVETLMQVRNYPFSTKIEVAS